MPDIEITCQEEDLGRWTDHIKKKNLPSICECGGDQLEIPHHYEWCPRASHEQDNENEDSRTRLLTNSLMTRTGFIQD